MNWPWSELGLPGPSDLAAVRRAYAERLKTTHPEEDPEGFQRLHEAYQQARRAARKAGITPNIVPIRGGTDGARLSFLGLPCPNLGTGGGNGHGRYEYCCIQSMESAVRICVNIIRTYATREA